MGNIVLYKDTLSDEELTKHRAWIAVKAQALMGRYFQLPQDELVKRDILLGWMDTLQNFTDKEISSACATFLKRHPRTRPHEGHIYNIVIVSKYILYLLYIMSAFIRRVLNLDIIYNKCHILQVSYII